MKDIHSFCIGESHKGNNKPCQDCAFSASSDSLSIAIVSDGHGGERYFRSNIGSEIVVDVIKESIKDFKKNLSNSTLKKSLGKALFENMPFVQFPAQDNQLSSEQNREAEYIHDALLRLFSSIIYQWNIRIAEHAEKTQLTEWEIANVPQKYQDEFNANREDLAGALEKFYGCTFMAYVQTKTYWLAFHLGDGKCVMFDINEERPRFSQPIPWDEKCFLNKTTSICDSNPLSEIRYCYCGDGTFPEAMFLGSDGIDDSFGDGERLYDFYIQIYQTLASKGIKRTKLELKESLPIISQRGSKDDMSVACVYNEKNLKNNITILNKFLIKKVEKQLEGLDSQFSNLYAKIEAYYSKKKLSAKEQIECHYAEIDWRKTVELETQLHKKLLILGIEKTQPTRSLPNKWSEERPKNEAQEVTLPVENTEMANQQSNDSEPIVKEDTSSDATIADKEKETHIEPEETLDAVSEESGQHDSDVSIVGDEDIQPEKQVVNNESIETNK